MRRILIDDKIKGLADEYVEDFPREVGGVEACLRGLANKLKRPSTKFFICTAFEGKKIKKSGRKITIADAVEASNAEQPIKDKQESYKIEIQKGNKCKKISEYVEAIADRYGVINKLLPSQYDDIIDTMEKILGDVMVEDVWVQIRGKRKGKRPLYELIVDAMRYCDVRAKLMPKYIKKLEIKTCVYCNSQFALTTLIEDVHEKIKTGKRGRPKEARVIPLMGGYYELDHNKPKSKYPYLCTNFYNLQPCCSSCNKRKSAQDLPFSIYYEDGDQHPEPLRFAISPQDVIDFHTKGKCRGIKPYLCDEANPTQRVLPRKDGTLAERFNHIFDIDKVYAEHEDEVEELLWRNRIYTQGIVSATSSQFMSLKIEGFDFARYILGTYPDRNDAFKRPLTMMKQDIWEQVSEKEKELG